MTPMPQAEIDAVLDDGWTAEPGPSTSSGTQGGFGSEAQGGFGSEAQAEEVR